MQQAFGRGDFTLRFVWNACVHSEDGEKSVPFGFCTLLCAFMFRLWDDAIYIQFTSLTQPLGAASENGSIKWSVLCCCLFISANAIAHLPDNLGYREQHHQMQQRDFSVANVPIATDRSIAIARLGSRLHVQKPCSNRDAVRTCDAD